MLEFVAENGEREEVGGGPAMNERGDRWLRNAVLGWTAFLSVFLWTSLNRAAWRPELATWVGFGLEGRGAGSWIFPVAAAAVVAVLLFYLEGRGRWRGVFHALLLAIHLPISAYLGYIVWTYGWDIMFQGDTWGWRLPLWMLLIPFVGFACSSVVLVIRERQGAGPPVVGWRAIDRRGLVLAIALTPVIALTFGSGAEFDGRAKAATALAVVQWLVLISSIQASPTGAADPPLTPAREP